MMTTKICLKCHASFVPVYKEIYCDDCTYRKIIMEESKKYDLNNTKEVKQDGNNT